MNAFKSGRLALGPGRYGRGGRATLAWSRPRYAPGADVSGWRSRTTFNRPLNQ